MSFSDVVLEIQRKREANERKQYSESEVMNRAIRSLFPEMENDETTKAMEENSEKETGNTDREKEKSKKEEKETKKGNEVEEERNEEIEQGFYFDFVLLCV